MVSTTAMKLGISIIDTINRVTVEQNGEPRELRVIVLKEVAYLSSRVLG